jgi:hypothetical protein
MTPVIGLVQRHREVLSGGYRPSRQFLGGAIDRHDLLQVWNVYVNVGAIFFQLERFRLAAEFIDFIQTLVGHRIDGCDCRILFSIAAADVDALVRGVVAHIVRAAIEVDGGDEFVRIAIVDVDLAFFAGTKSLLASGEKATPCGFGTPVISWARAP